MHMRLENRVRELRARFRISQQELADRIEVSRQTIALIERGDYSPSVVIALKMAQLFNEPVETIFYLEEEKT
jgi:putative transcriptional regulator